MGFYGDKKMNSRSSRRLNRINLVFAIILVFLICGAVDGQRAQVADRSRSAKSQLLQSTNIGCALIIASPVGSLQSQLIEDVLSVELMLNGISVISREKKIKTETGKLAVIEQKLRAMAVAEPNETSIDPNIQPIEALGLAKECGVHAIITITVLEDVVQRNIYSNNPTHQIAEVRSEQVIQALSWTIVGVGDGELLAAGYIDNSENPQRAVPAAQDLGRAITQVIRK